MALIGVIGDLVSKTFTSVMDEIRLSPEKKAEVQLKLDEMKQASDQADRDLEGKLNDIAGQNIRQDTSSSDWFVRRARPYFLWIVATAIGIDLLIFPLVSLASGHGLAPIPIPSDIMEVFKYGFMGYSGLRTIEKVLGKA